MRQKMKTASRGPISHIHKIQKSVSMRRTRARALLKAAYQEVGSKMRSLEHEFLPLDTDPVLKVLWEHERDAAYDRL